MRLPALPVLAAVLCLCAPAPAGEPAADYEALLKKVVRKDGVDYTTLKKERAAVDRYAKWLQTASPGKTDRARIAFWINAYNALTLQQVLDTKPETGSYSVHGVKGFWTKRTWKVGGRKRLSLDAIENTILRKEFTEPRVHFAVNCASRSCPPLAPELYREETLDEVLTQATRAYLADDEQNKFDLARRKAKISMLFKWYRSDFEQGRKNGMRLFLARYATTGSLERSLRENRWRIRFLGYDWSLNEAGAKKAKREEQVHPIWIALYVLAALGLLLYGLHAFKLLFWRARHKDRHAAELRAARLGSRLGRTTFPSLLVQVPIYNESAVAHRVIEAVAALDYPRDRLEIQVLDDSTDETQRIVDRAARRYGVEVVRRSHRSGFKAGALAAGMRRSGAEFIAIFDADFVPPPDFLRRALPLFDLAGRVGCVQGRWTHLNRTQNWLTRAQAVAVDAHFLVQQHARAAAGCFLNFNGTAGLWRRAAIEDAGGWSGDTLTEDLDLSYRAQLRGWRIAFDPDLTAPAELPPTIAAFKSQQRRWACGTTQCARKHLGHIWRSDQPFRIKTEATAHLLGYAACLAMVALIALLPLGVWHGRVFAPFLWFSGFGPISVVIAGQRARGRLAWGDILLCFFVCLGACANNAVAVVRGLARPIRTFVRTPKQGSRLIRPRTPAPRLETLMAALTVSTVLLLAPGQPWAMAVYAFFCSAGFCFLTAYWWVAER